MKDADCVAFLQAVLPRLGMRWAGFRKVRKLVCKRVSRRLRELRLTDLHEYRAYLEHHPGEWNTLDAFCRIPISRFYRDAGVFASLEREVLPAIAQGAARGQRSALSFWSACCAAGEEPYSLALLWHGGLQRQFPQLHLHILATDVDAQLLERARKGCYRASSLKSLTPDLLAAAFVPFDTQWCLRNEFRQVEFVQQDIRQTLPSGEFDLILCRNAVLTYLAPALQSSVMEGVVARLRPGGTLVTGIHERLPEGLTALEAWPGARGIYRKPGPAPT